MNSRIEYIVILHQCYMSSSHLHSLDTVTSTQTLSSRSTVSSESVISLYRTAISNVLHFAWWSKLSLPIRQAPSCFGRIEVKYNVPACLSPCIRNFRSTRPCMLLIYLSAQMVLGNRKMSLQCPRYMDHRNLIISINSPIAGLDSLHQLVSSLTCSPNAAVTSAEFRNWNVT